MHIADWIVAPDSYKKKKKKKSKIAQQGTFQHIVFIAQHFNIKYKQKRLPKHHSE